MAEAALAQPRSKWLAHDETLKRLWLDGVPASEIAARLGSGISKNGVIGRLRDIGLIGKGVGRATRSKLARVKATKAPTPPLGRAEGIGHSAGSSAGAEGGMAVCRGGRGGARDHRSGARGANDRQRWNFHSAAAQRALPLSAGRSARRGFLLLRRADASPALLRGASCDQLPAAGAAQVPRQRAVIR